MFHDLGCLMSKLFILYDILLCQSVKAVWQLLAGQQLQKALSFDKNI